MEFHVPAAQGARQPETDSGPRLFVLPHAGGSSLVFQNWLELFPRNWDIRPLDAPGHGRLMNLPLISDGDALVDHFLDRLGPELGSTDRPFAFFGHSMGALVAYELTRRLAEQGRPLPCWLGISACDVPDPVHGLSARFPGRDLSDEGLRDTLTLLGGAPDRVLRDPGLWEVFAPVVRADLRLIRTWRPAPVRAPLPVPASAFAGLRDRAAPPGRLAGWADRFGTFLGLHTFPGGHFYFQTDPAPLTSAITADIRTALTPTAIR
ncbi:thioesterase II family protein [Streptomyces sp. NPDC001480]|uniref:thioesterase II family protein n=1 Tax=Streptomyces sp. NPDC001480 TaxID=3364577 RepID=UPI0036C62241